jgi:FkbM family methyltransferase
MGAANFILSLKRIARFPGGHRPRAIARHLLWQIQRHRHRYPYEIFLTSSSKLSITCPEAQNGCAALAWSLGRYDFDNMAFLQDILQRLPGRKVFFDIGANIGVYSLLASESHDVAVYSFEPHPATAAILSHNIEVNNRANAKVVQLALSSSTGELSFTDNPGSPVNQLTTDDSPKDRTISIQALRAEDFCHQHGITPDIIKIDVEGHEGGVLEGFGPILKGVKALVIEENLPLEVLQACLPGDLFIPLYVDFGKRLLHPTNHAMGQDIVFINRSFLPELIQLGYQTSPEAGV